MPFELKNARATYQRLVTKMFVDLIWKTAEIYVDDMLVKILKADDHVKYIVGVFQIVWLYIMRLNPPKSAFRVVLEKFLGYMVN